jgi:hypothetical protein
MMSPFGPYATFDECVAKNSDKVSPEGFCAFLHHKITGTWPGQMKETRPEVFVNRYHDEMSNGKSEHEAYKLATEAASAEGWELTRLGWIKQFQAPKMKTITGVKIFATGKWTDASGDTKYWDDKDLSNMIEAFTAGVPAVVPVKCGHTTDHFNEEVAKSLEVPVDVITGEHGQGQIKLGSVGTMKKSGDLIIASFDKVPEQIANLIEGGLYSTVSVEIEDAVGDFGPVITGVALLGAEEPAVDKATLDRALVFGGKRNGARVLSFKVGDDIPINVLRAELKRVQAKMADYIKGMRGAPLFRAMFGELNNIFERMTGKHSQYRESDVPEEVRAYADAHFQGNIRALINWVGRVGFDNCVTALTGKEGITDPVRVCGWLKGQAHSKSIKGGGKMLPKQLQGMKADEIKKMKVSDLAAKLQEAEEPEEVTVEEIVEALPETPAKGIEDIMAALGLAADDTVENALAAIEALKAGKPPEGEPTEPAEGEMAKEMKKATDRIVTLETSELVRDWEDKVREFTSIPGTPREHAVSLANIQQKAGKDAAEMQFNALKEANDKASEANKIIGTTRTKPDASYEGYIKRYLKDNPKATRGDAIKAFRKEHPDKRFQSA